MLAKYVPAKLTPFSFEQADEAMTAALRDKLGSQPTREARALALAKTGLETGRWKAIWCNNWGNVKAGDTYEGMFTCITLNEVLKGKVVWFAPDGELAGGRGSALKGPAVPVPPGHPQTRMRAYANRFDGAFSYVDFVAGGRYAAAWQRLLVGDAAGYVHLLKVAGYFTADEATYAKTVIALQKEFLAKLNGQNPEPHETDDHEWEAIRAAVVGSSWQDTQDAIGGAGANVLTDEAKTDPSELAPESERS